MEAHSVTGNLHDSRERIRALLIPDPVTGRIEADTFPRSAVMRFLFNPGSRRLAFGAASTLVMLAARRRVGGGSIWPQLTQSVGNLLGLARR
jgi:hypothetical protein